MEHSWRELWVESGRELPLRELPLRELPLRELPFFSENDIHNNFKVKNQLAPCSGLFQTKYKTDTDIHRVKS